MDRVGGVAAGVGGAKEKLKAVGAGATCEVCAAEGPGTGGAGGAENDATGLELENGTVPG